MKPIWTNEGLWVRVGVIVSLVWIMVILVALAVGPYGNLIQGAILALVGVGFIFIVCIGGPWIASAVDNKPNDN